MAIRILVVGDSKVGKTALTVRLLTRRYIGEYSSSTDSMYKCTIEVDNVSTRVEVLDTINRPGQPPDVDENQVMWAGAHVVVYSVLSRESFLRAASLASAINALKTSSTPLLLLGNKVDLDPGREVGVQEGRQMSRELGCIHDEVSAAEDLAGTLQAFHTLIKEVQLAQPSRLSSRKRNKNPLDNVSKKLGAIFGKKETNVSNNNEATGMS
ncbi:ras-related and estrogen-regulated growth inhibitor-like protein [Biomphalaria glabrata]|uniref:small monomeric GTPase n=1 Tax=Biomphalaria glabrata TaxID=6526 RepID=A0A9W3APN9_BIOGL|nr:ras-related and estrogen-regulated growth inhibitor-like protein [Biomphalaria glabrata]XP_055889194.1 ras-related and estrogen-regulated growth inhibitor-like protein [Biomphalaria glabrata]XP_055889195.1 ras-related and estrogen-regulated growth inhibitor-like protein [Biomphalaria glabrata]XP_055889196.1 ras-related and estrogen-regulated growth inhibitor-like protein [Biomphalaria glabrata]